MGELDASELKHMKDQTASGGGIICKRKASENVGLFLHGAKELVTKCVEMAEVVICLFSLIRPALKPSKCLSLLVYGIRQNASKTAV